MSDIKALSGCMPKWASSVIDADTECSALGAHNVTLYNVLRADNEQGILL